MAQCHAEGKKHPTSAIDLYVGVFNSKLYSSNAGNGNVDHYQSWSRYNAANYNTAPANGDSFRKEITSERLSLFSGSFREDTLKIKAFTKADVGSVDTHGTNFKSGSYNVGSDHAANRSSNPNGGLVVGATKVGGSPNGVLDLKNGTNGNLAVASSPICNGSIQKKESSEVVSAKGANYSNGELTKWGAKPAPASETGLMTGTSNGNVTGARNQKSGELSVATSNGGIGPKGSPNRGSSNGGTSVKGSPNGGSPVVGSLRVGGHVSGEFPLHGGSSHGGSSNGGSSNGGSPTAEVARSARASSVGNIMGNGSSPTSVSSRGIGNIMGAGIITGNLGNLKPSSTKAVSNDNQPSTATLRGISTARKSGEMTPVSNGNLRGMSTPRFSGEGNLMNGGIITGSTPGAVAKGAATARSNGCSPQRNHCGAGPTTGPAIVSNVGNLCRGNWNGNVLSGHGNLSNGACKANGRVEVANGNVLSNNGVGGKVNGKVENHRNGVETSGDCFQARRAVSCADPEEIKNAGNEQYKKGHFSEALALYDRAIAMSPGHAPYRSNRAAALTGLGRLGEAVQECEEAIRLDPCYARAHQRAASLYLRIGLVESAKRHFQAAGQQTDLGDIQRLQSIERHISRCIEARKLGDWKAVIRESDAAVVAGADSAPQIFGYKSEALLKLHRPEEADTVCAAAQRVERSLIKPGVAPADSFLFIIRAQIDMSLGRFEGAIVAAESAARIDPRNAEVSALLRKSRAVGHTRTSGNELFKAGRFFEACALYGEGLESDPTNAVLLCNRAACRSKVGQWEKAVEDCNAALNVQPNYTKALMRRADCNTKLERWEDALRDYEILRKEMPGDMEVARGLFDVQVAIKKSRGEEIYKMKFGGEVEEVSNNEQFREAVTSPGLAVVQFNTRWSERCRQISPFIDQLCKRYPCVNFVKVDVDDNPYLAKTESVSFVPTFKIYKNGCKVKEILGPSQQALEYAVKHYSL